MKWVFGILCLFFAAWSAGVRVHPENAADLFYREDFKNYYELEFFSGQRLTGRLVSESSDSFEMTLGAGTAVFKKNEIKQRRLLEPAEIKTGKYTNIIFQKTDPKGSLLTARYEDSFFYTAEKRISALLSQMASSFRKESASWNPLNSTQFEETAAQNPETEFLPSTGTQALPIPGLGSGGSGSSEKNQEQNYSALLKAGLEQLRNANP